MTMTEEFVSLFEFLAFGLQCISVRGSVPGGGEQGAPLGVVGG
jgi:hypothetical protein